MPKPNQAIGRSDRSANIQLAPSVDEREIAHFRGLAATWWDTAGPFWPLHQLNRLRMTWIIAQCGQSARSAAHNDMPLNGLRALDIGCGGGILSESLAANGADVTGIDVVEKNIQVARNHARQSQLPVSYHVSSAEDLAARAETYDVVFNMEVVEHVADLDTFLDATARLVKPGGKLFLATINRTPLAWLFAILGAEYVLRWLPRGTHHYAKLRKPDEIVARLSRHEVVPKAWAGVRVNPITRRFSLSDSRKVNYMLCATRGLGAAL